MLIITNYFYFIFRSACIECMKTEYWCINVYQITVLLLPMQLFFYALVVNFFTFKNQEQKTKNSEQKTKNSTTFIALKSVIILILVYTVLTPIYTVKLLFHLYYTKLVYITLKKEYYLLDTQL
jgi:hypothetical protein